MRIRPTQWIVGSLLLLLIFYPEFHFSKKISPYGILLIDRSESMKNVRDVDIDSPVPLKVMEFGRDVSGTAIGHALISAIRRFDGASFILLFSDGANTGGISPLKVARDIDIPVFIKYPSAPSVSRSYISVFGPDVVFESEEVIFHVHYKTPFYSSLEMITDDYSIVRSVRGEGIQIFEIKKDVGKYRVQFILSRGDSSLIRVERNIHIKSRPEVLVYTGKLEWNYKFFIRYMIDKDYRVNGIWGEEIPDDLIFKYDVVVFINYNKRNKTIDRYTKSGGKFITVGRYHSSYNYLPVIAPNLTDISKILPESEYIKPGGLRSGAEGINIKDVAVGYKMNYGKGRVVQFTYLDLWKLKLIGEGIYKKDLFSELMDKIMHELLKEKFSISYPDRLLYGEKFSIVSSPVPPDSFVWDGLHKLVKGRTLSINFPDVGMHHFSVTFPSTTFVESTEVLKMNLDRFELDTNLLNSIAILSGGGRWIEDFDDSEFDYKEEEVYLNLRHNWFFLGFLLTILFFDWYLWMRGK